MKNNRGCLFVLFYLIRLAGILCVVAGFFSFLNFLFDLGLTLDDADLPADWKFGLFFVILGAIIFGISMVFVNAKVLEKIRKHKALGALSVVLGLGAITGGIWGLIYYMDRPLIIYDIIQRNDKLAAQEYFQKFDPGKQDINRYLVYAIGHKKEKVIPVLIENGADVQQRISWSDNTHIPLTFYTAYSSSPEILQILINNGGEIKDTVSPDPQNILSLALQGDKSSETKMEMVKILVKAGIPIDTPGTLDRTPLYPAIDTMNREMVKWFLENGADPNHRDERGNTPLIYTVENFEGKEKGKLKIVEILLEYKANPGLEDKSGISAMDAARLRNYREIMEVLKKADS
jgi:hypothetical protein